jgi:hypothetical protein
MFTSLEKRWLFILSLTINFVVLFILLQLTFIDTSFAVIPGWHTIMFPRNISVTILISLCLFALGFAYVIIKLMYLLLTQMITRINNKQEKK